MNPKKRKKKNLTFFIIIFTFKNGFAREKAGEIQKSLNDDPDSKLCLFERERERERKRGEQLLFFVCFRKTRKLRARDIEIRAKKKKKKKKF